MLGEDELEQIQNFNFNFNFNFNSNFNFKAMARRTSALQNFYCGVSSQFRA